MLVFTLQRASLLAVKHCLFLDRMGALCWESLEPQERHPRRSLLGAGFVPRSNQIR